MTEPTDVTPTQDRYLRELATGPKTTRDFVLSQMVSGHSAGKMLKKLQDAGLVRSSKLRGAPGNVYIYELTTPYNELNLRICNRSTRGLPVSDAEIHYVAKLRNAGLTGLRLKEAHLRKYPDRPASSVLQTVLPKAKARGLCR